MTTAYERCNTELHDKYEHFKKGEGKLAGFIFFFLFAIASAGCTLGAMILDIHLRGEYDSCNLPTPPLILVVGALLFKVLPFVYFSWLHSMDGDGRLPTTPMVALNMAGRTPEPKPAQQVWSSAAPPKPESPRLEDATNSSEVIRRNVRRSVILACMMVPYLAKAVAVGVYATLAMLAHTNAWTWDNADAPVDFRRRLHFIIGLLVASLTLDFGPMIYGHYVSMMKRETLYRMYLDACASVPQKAI